MDKIQKVEMKRDWYDRLMLICVLTTTVVAFWGLGIKLPQIQESLTKIYDFPDVEVILQPDISPRGQMVNYTVEILNKGNLPVNEVRIYKNENYTNFTCGPAPSDWTLYYATGVSDFCVFYIDTKNPIGMGEYIRFSFRAYSPQEGCIMKWIVRVVGDKKPVATFTFNYPTTTLENCQPS